MKKNKIFLLLFLLTAAFKITAVPEVILKDQVIQGDVLSVFVRDEVPLDSVKGTLFVDGQTVCEVNGFPAQPGDQGKFTQVLLFGINSTQAAGRGELVLEAVTREGAVRLVRNVNITSGKFLREDIPLSTPMSDLRQSDDPEKARQSRALYELLLSVNPEHVFLDVPFQLPLEGARRTSFYGDRRKFLYTDGKEAGSIHFGIDFSANPGTPVYSAGKGLVVFSGSRILTGNTVVIEHLPGVYSLYYHMQDIFSSLGILVDTGTMIGTVGATGLVTGAHLHWEIRVNGVPVAPDPLTKTSLLDKNLIMNIVKVQ